MQRVRQRLRHRVLYRLLRVYRLWQRMPDWVLGLRKRMSYRVLQLWRHVRR